MTPSPNIISSCSPLNDDILREIFIHFVSEHGESSKCFMLDKYALPIRFYPQLSVSRVCSSWRHVALLIPQLWDNVMIRWLTKSNLSIARQYLSRARNLPISITFGPNITGWKDWSPLSDFLSSYQLRSLAFLAMDPRFLALLHDLPGRSAENLESLSLFVDSKEAGIDLNDIKYPKLASVSISGAYRISVFGSSLRIFDGRLLSMTVIEGWDLLSRCPSLEEVRLRMGCTPGDSQRLPPESPIYHRRLRTLIFESRFSSVAPFSVFTAALALPSLEKMHLFNAWSVTAFQLLAQQSNHFPNLSDFLLDIPTVDAGTILALMPSVTRVSLGCDRFNGGVTFTFDQRALGGDVTFTFDQRALDGLASGSLAPRLQYLVGHISNGKAFMDMVESRMVNAQMSSNGVPAPFKKVVVTSPFGSDVARLHDMQRQGIPIYRYLIE